jgi:plastocyanin
VQGDSAAGMKISLDRPGWVPIDGAGAAGGAHQGFVVPIRRDQDQRLRRPILLHSPTTHGRSFRVGAVTLMRTSHPHTIYDPTRWRAKWPALVLPCLVAAVGALPATAQTTRVVRLEVEPENEVYRFVPARIAVRPGDVIRFKVSSGAPHNIAFEGAELSPAAHEALNAAMINRTGDLSGPVLDRAGAEYRLVVPALPPGRYRFFCTPHRAYDMQGELIVGR